MVRVVGEALLPGVVTRIMGAGLGAGNIRRVITAAGATTVVVVSELPPFFVEYNIPVVIPELGFVIDTGL